jgi:UDP-N-acetylglucosamine 2-epimerase (non-hydrolysing)
MKKIACIFGTRPEAIKMAPVIQSLRKLPDVFKVSTICTGQHRELISPLTEWFDLDIALNMDVMAPNQDLNQLASRLLSEFGKLFQEERFDGVIAQGDTTSVLVSALAAFHNRIPFFHVEAGLRTYDMNFPFPEEMNRVVVSRIASLHFAPTEQSAENLRREGVPEERVINVGNTVIDALNFTVQKLSSEPEKAVPEERLVLVTAHRRENFGEPLLRICKAIRQLALAHTDTQFIFPVHPNPNVRLVVEQHLSELPNVMLLDPLPYPQLVDYLRRCRLVLTDSGGLQEEAPALGKPVLVLREETERPELVELGGSKLVGSSEEAIIGEVTALLTDDEAHRKMVIGSSPYGDGHAADRLAQELCSFFAQRG